ncbi:MAG: SDR family NAD(P)-dependent oxidoreductase, partial [Sphingobium phenoxybenzoativorans]
MGSLTGKRIIVTGGASGMGAAMVRGFAEEGAKVAAFHRNETGERVLQALSADAAPLVQFFRCDVSQKAEVDQAFAEAAAWLGGLDVMVNAAGIAPGAPSHEITVQDWDDVFAINARGTFLSNQAAFPLLRIEPLQGHGDARVEL